jgi:pyruvate ferredoxin oxidoreductase gamma subunit
MFEIRFHGRGGQGAKIASRILGRSGFLAGLHAQDFALFGAERRGAPVVACTRLSEQPVDRRGYIEEPDLVVVMDATLLKEAAAQVFHGVLPITPLFVNGAAGLLDSSASPPANYILIDLDRIAREQIGSDFVSAAAAAVAAKSIPAISAEFLGLACRTELGEMGATQELVEKNVAAACAAYRLAPAVDLQRAIKTGSVAPVALQVVSYLGSAQSAGPTIRHRGSAALRETGNWRTERPEIDLAKCKRCFLCYLYCPEAAMKLDAENFPHVDYDHCKGCMICYEECPTDAISRKLEA